MQATFDFPRFSLFAADLNEKAVKKSSEKNLKNILYTPRTIQNRKNSNMFEFIIFFFEKDFLRIAKEKKYRNNAQQSNKATENRERGQTKKGLQVRSYHSVKLSDNTFSTSFTSPLHEVNLNLWQYFQVKCFVHQFQII